MSFLRRCKVNPQTAKTLIGFKDFCTRMLAQVVIRSPFELNEFLHTPKTIVEIAETKGLRNLKLVELLLETLANHNILKRVGGKYQWLGFDFKVTDNERVFITSTGPAVAEYYGVLSKNLPRVLEGEEVKTSIPLTVYDAFFSSDLTNLIIDQALASMNNLFPKARDREVIIDLFAGTGWSTIILAEAFHPKKIYALEPRDSRFTPIAQENINIVLEDPLATAIEFLPTTLMESPIREDVDMIFGLSPFQWIMPSDWLQLTARIYSLLKEEGCVIGFQLMRDESTLKGSLPHEPFLSVFQKFTQLPAVDRINSILLEAGFVKPYLSCNSFFFAQK